MTNIKDTGRNGNVSYQTSHVMMIIIWTTLRTGPTSKTTSPAETVAVAVTEVVVVGIKVFERHAGHHAVTLQLLL